MHAITKYDSNALLSEIAIYGDTIYLAGQVPDDDALDFLGQAQQVFANIDKALAQAGSDKGKMLSAQVFIKDLGDMDDFNAAWQQWLAGAVPPVRATVQANLVNPRWLLEIVVIAGRY